MKKNFFAKIGHFAVVGALLFNTFGVALVHAEVSTVGFKTASAGVTEGDGTYTIPFVLSQPVTADAGLDVCFGAGGTASTTDDYLFDISNGGTYCQVAGQYTYTVHLVKGESRGSIGVVVQDDQIVEGDEALVLTMLDVQANATVNSDPSPEASVDANNNTFTLTIHDNDIYAPTVSETHNTVMEGEQASEQTVSAPGVEVATLTNNSDTDLDYILDFSGTATMSNDYDVAWFETPEILSIMSNQTNNFLTIRSHSSVTLYVYASGAQDDTAYEGTESATFSIKKAVDPNDETNIIADFSNNPIEFSVNILDNDTNVAFGTSSSLVPPTSGNANVAKIVNNSDLDVAVSFTLEGTAGLGTDYDLRNEAPLLNFGSEAIKWLVPANSSSSLPITINDNIGVEKKIVVSITGIEYQDGESILPLNPVSEQLSHTVFLNTSPVLTEATLQNQSIDLYTTTTATISNEIIKAAFNDPDENRLMFSVSGNTNESAVTANFDDVSNLTLTGLHVGTSTIEVTADDQYNGIVTTTFDVVVTDSTPTNNGGGTFLPNTPPTAAFTTGQEVTIAVNTEVTFDASDSTDKEGNIQFYFWNFGDESAEEYYTAPTVTHTYTTIGTYTLAVRVRDSHGAESTATVAVHVVKENGSTPTTETGNSGTPSTSTPSTDNGTPTDNGNTPEETRETTVPPTRETTTPGTPTEATPSGEEVTEEPTTDNTEQKTTNDNGEEVETPTTEEKQGLPTWIRIFFGSGAVAAIAGAGIAINRARKAL
ncbi:MAG: hypothetical protein AUJ37_03680 [Candidatus Magasanikbacteria bacterium CG1_02_41_34]|nr:MAG: hypothetical protein AUJ37_03680 [Candidatus Magasanikbacteria bacterium CG1_02_41_34]